MMNIKRVLFPTDLTPLAEETFAYAGHLAARHGAELHVLHVAPPHKEVERAPADFLPLVEQEAKGDRFFLPVEEDPGEYTRRVGSVPVHYHLVHCTSPVMGILEYADEGDIDLIVMATHGRRGLDRLLDRSVTEAIVRQAHCPTFSIRGDLAPPRPIRRLLVPVDFSDHTRRQVSYAAALAATYDARLDVLHVIEEHTPPDEYGPEVREYATAMQGESVQERIRQALRDLVEEAPDLERAFHVHVTMGHPATEIVRVATEKEIDLLVMATHGHTALERFLIGSVTERVVRTASCPVFTVRSVGKSLVSEAPPEGSGG